MKWLFNYIRNGIRQAVLDGVGDALTVLDGDGQTPEPPLIPEALKRRLALPAVEEPVEEANGKKKGAAK